MKWLLLTAERKARNALEKERRDGARRDDKLTFWPSTQQEQAEEASANLPIPCQIQVILRYLRSARSNGTHRQPAATSRLRVLPLKPHVNQDLGYQ